MANAEMKSGQGFKKHMISTGYEALILGRAATYGGKKDAENIKLKHSGLLDDISQTYDEKEFVRRSLGLERREKDEPIYEQKEYPEPVLEGKDLERAQICLRDVILTEKPYRSITPDIAKVFLGAFIEEETMVIDVRSATAELCFEALGRGRQRARSEVDDLLTQLATRNLGTTAEHSTTLLAPPESEGEIIVSRNARQAA